MRGISASLVVVALLSSGCLFGRPNPQIDEIDYDDGVTTKFDYDDDGYLVEVKKNYDDPPDPLVYSLKWEDGLLVEIKIEQGSSEVTAEIEHDDQGRLESATLRGEGMRADYEYKYDDEGRFEGFEATSEQEGSELKNEAVLAIEYDDDGAAAEWTRTSSFGESESVTKTTFEFEGARLSKQEVEEDGDTTGKGEYSYDDKGRPEKLTRTTESDGEETSETEVAISYDDDGLLEGWEIETSYEGGDPIKNDVEVSYGEGEARGIEMTPGDAFPFFDVKGGSYNTFGDLKLQLPRYLVSW